MHLKRMVLKINYIYNSLIKLNFTKLECFHQLGVYKKEHRDSSTSLLPWRLAFGQ